MTNTPPLKCYLLCFLLLLSFSNKAQDCSKVNKKIVKRIQKDISQLASDQMEGREPGTSGEIKARNYIIDRMQEIALHPKGSNEFIQAFSYHEPVKQKANQTSLFLNNKRLRIGHEFYPTTHSSNGRIKDVPVLSIGHGIHLPHQAYSDYEKLNVTINGYVGLMDISTPDDLNVEAPSLSSRAIEAVNRGAVALLLFHSNLNTPVPDKFFKQINSVGVPVVYLKNKAFDIVPNLFIENASLSIIQFVDPTQAHNVIGFIDNNADKTVVISAHYDHLGYGNSGSKYKGPKKIHNGADDNASGTAALLELAYFIQNNKIKEENNFLFIAFSAEEKGLLGSRYFVNNPTIDLNKINYVLNMDMIGRMEKDMPLTIEGIGGSLIWEQTLKEIECNAFPLTLKKREDGPSDHAAFYHAGIPALHFWTGKHDDYHMPNDDIDKINFEAEAQIIAFIESLIMEMETKGKILFHNRQK